MIRAVLLSETAGVVAAGGCNHVLGGIVAAGGSVAEVFGRAHRLRGNLRLSRMIRRGRPDVVPVAEEHARLVSSGRAGAVADDGALGHTLAILGHGIQPRA